MTTRMMTRTTTEMESNLLKRLELAAKCQKWLTEPMDKAEADRTLREDFVAWLADVKELMALTLADEDEITNKAATLLDVLEPHMHLLEGPDIHGALEALREETGERIVAWEEHQKDQDDHAKHSD